MSTTKSRDARNRLWINDYKKSHPCQICGEGRIACLDFHHVGDEKSAKISYLVGDHVTIDRLIEEVDKCIVVCANCHRIIHSE